MCIIATVPPEGYEVILTALKQSDLNYVRDSKEYQSELVMSGMDERGVNYTLFVFVNTYGPNARSSFFPLDLQDPAGT